MQQLILISDTVIQLTCSRLSTHEHFEYLKQQLNDYGAVLLNQEFGADREQLHYRLYSSTFIVFYEQLSDTIWIELHNKENNLLQDFYRLIGQ